MTNEKNNENISEDLAAKMIQDLSFDEFDKVNLIVCNDVDKMIEWNDHDRNNDNNNKNSKIVDFQWESLTFGHKREIWIEIMFLINRYDLLRGLSSCKRAAQNQIQEKTYFPLIKRLLLRVYEGMTTKREEEFRAAIQTLKPTATSTMDLKVVTLGSLLCCFGNRGSHLDELVRICKQIGWKDMVEQINLYKSQTVSGEYLIDRSQQTIGLCLIVNIMTSIREGSEMDIKLLRGVFEEFHFKVIDLLDFDRDKLISELKRLASMDHSDESIFVCCLMGHGTKDGLCCENGEYVSIKSEIIREFHGDKCPTLKEKPKLFFVQACRTLPLPNGTSLKINSKPVHVDRANSSTGTDALSVPENENGTDIHNGADILQSYATVEGDPAIRYEDGSPYIKTLTNNLREFGKTMDIFKILTKVNKDVSKDIIPTDGCQQPTFESTLSKTLKLG